MAEAGKLCDFIWQFEYANRWVTFNEDEICALNDAAKKGDRIVDLPPPSRDPHTHVKADLKHMEIDKGFACGKHPIRCVIYSDNFYAWHWMNNNGDWVSYRPEDAFALEASFQKGEDSCKLTITSTEGKQRSYKVTFAAKSQVNIETEFKRPVSHKAVDVSYFPDALLNRIKEKGSAVPLGPTDAPQKTAMDATGLQEETAAEVESDSVSKSEDSEIDMSPIVLPVSDNLVSESSSESSRDRDLLMDLDA